MRFVPGLASVLACALLLPSGVKAQQACPQPPALERVSGRNIFTEQQEIDLGDAMGDSLAHDFPLIEDPKLTAHVEELGARLARYLPPNNLRFRYFLIDWPEVNAFSLSGGRIYVARKMVALTRSDDELAGVLAHEMGHIVTHQQAIEMTRAMKQRLGITQVGDRADIYDKFQRMLENERRKPTHVHEEGEGDQYIADQVALFAMARAGFAPQAYVDLWDRFNETRGNAGNWWTDFLGHTKPEQKRLRQLLKSASAMPPECAHINPTSSREFEAWQAKVIGSTTGTHTESLPGLVMRQKLAVPLRPDITRLRFSPNGKYVLAQDEGGIHVLSRDPFQLLFFIDAPGADAGAFTPDSKSVVFKTPSLRVETWDIASQQRTSVCEVLLRAGCLQSALSPDGRFVACLNKEFALELVDVASGEELASKKNFFQVRSWFSWLIFLAEVEENANLRLAHLSFSPDGHHFLAGTSFTDFAFDLEEKHEIKLPGSIRNAAHWEFTFLDRERVIGLNPSNPSKSVLLKFPGGEHLGEVTLVHGLTLEPTPQGKYIAVGPLKTGKRGFLDPSTGKLHGICQEDAGDIYNDTIVYEELDGRLQQVEMPSGNVVARARLTQSHLGDSRTIAVSEDFSWLAASTRSRGAVWGLGLNVRVQHVRAFTNGWFGEDDSFYAEFPEREKQERSIVQLNSLGEASPVFSIGNLLASLEGPYVLVRTPSRDNPYQRKDWTYELRDFRTKTTVWTRHFPQERPSLAWAPDYTAVLMGWPVASEAAHEEMKQFPELKASAEREDIFYELTDLKSNAVLGKFVLKTNRYSFFAKSARISGDWAVFEVSGERVLTYSIASGKEVGHVFGHAPVISNAAGMYAVTASENAVYLYGLADSQLRGTYRFAVSIAFKKFSADGKRLFVLTRDQTAYVLDVTASDATQSSAAAQ